MKCLTFIGTQHQIQKTSEVSAVKIDAIFITHMHGDHLFGIQGFDLQLIDHLTFLQTSCFHVFIW